MLAAKRYYPDCPDDKLGDFLFSATPFPFGTDKDVARCLSAARADGAATWEDAIDYASDQLDRSMNAIRWGYGD